jgi:hypothetical protein
MALSTPTALSVPVPADQTPEFSASLANNVTQVQDIDSLLSNFPGIPDLNSTGPTQLVSFVSNGIDIPSFMPSLDVGSITDLAGFAAQAAGQQPLNVDSISSSLLNSATTGDLDINSLDPFGAFNLIEQAKGVVCNFQIPTISVPDFESMFNTGITDLENKFKSLLPKFTAPSDFDLEEYLKSAVSAFQRNLTNTFKTLYTKLFTCQSSSDQSA